LKRKAIMRGDIYWIEFDSLIGKRPALIIQNNIGNEYAPTVIVATITSTPSGKSYPTDVLLPNGTLSRKNSRILTATITTVDKDDLGQYITSLSDEIMEDVDLALLVSLGLEKHTKMSEDSSDIE